MKYQFGIIKRTYLWLIVGLVLVLGSWYLFVSNAKLSSEFTGGVKLTINTKIDTNKITSDLERYLGKQGYQDNQVESQFDNGVSVVTIKTDIQDDVKVNQLSEQIKKFLIEDKYITSTEQIIEQAVTGPSVGEYMQTAALKALIVGLIFMAIYMLFAFSTVRKYISPLNLAIVTIITMIFDITIPAGAYGFWMMVNPTIQIDSIFIIAILTTMGYSINDTIVIFDRVRENMEEHRVTEGGNIIYGKIFENSLRQTMGRSIATSIATIIAVIAMYIFGTGVIKTFSFTMGIGILAGTYSSIFIAAPLAYLLLGKFKKERSKL